MFFVKPVETSFYPAVIDVDLDAVVHNYERMTEYAQPSNVMAIVKADGYGYGRDEVALALWQRGARWFGVARVPEAVSLREDFVASDIPSDQARILTWMDGPDSDWVAALDADLDVSVGSADQLRGVVSGVRKLRDEGVFTDPARIHLKVDTGMSRGGVRLEELPELAQQVLAAEEAGEVTLVGLWSHLAQADDPEGPGAAATREQVNKFIRAEEILSQAGLVPQIRHLAATAGTIWFPETHLDLVRVGLGLYGYSPNPQVATSAELGLRPVGAYRTKITQVKLLQAGDSVSYGGTWQTDSPRWVGLLPIGYADGVTRALSNQAKFAVQTEGVIGEVPVAGRVCMDQTVLDLGTGDQPTAQVGDVVTLFGDPEAGEPSVDDWAEAAGTINYEVVARVPAHLERRYHQENTQ